jgi:hypothetical protein
MPVSESYTIDPGVNGCNIQIYTEQAVTNQYGRFQDWYGNPAGQPIPACQNYPTCQTLSTQHYLVAGYPFSHSVTWGCTSVTLGRQ